MIRMYLHTNQLSILQSSGTAFFHRQWTRVSWNVVVHQLLPNPIAKQLLFAMLHSSLDRRSTENKRVFTVYLEDSQPQTLSIYLKRSARESFANSTRACPRETVGESRPEWKLGVESLSGWNGPCLVAHASIYIHPWNGIASAITLKLGREYSCGCGKHELRA